MTRESCSGKQTDGSVWKKKIEDSLGSVSGSLGIDFHFSPF